MLAHTSYIKFDCQSKVVPSRQGNNEKRNALLKEAINERAKAQQKKPGLTEPQNT
jgi:hypothetical protein